MNATLALMLLGCPITRFDNPFWQDYLNCISPNPSFSFASSMLGLSALYAIISVEKHHTWPQRVSFSTVRALLHLPQISGWSHKLKMPMLQLLTSSWETSITRKMGSIPSFQIKPTTTWRIIILYSSTFELQILSLTNVLPWWILGINLEKDRQEHCKLDFVISCWSNDQTKLFIFSCYW